MNIEKRLGQNVRFANAEIDALKSENMSDLLTRGRRLRAQAFNTAIDDIAHRLRHLFD
jgi:hypothetical protein